MRRPSCLSDPFDVLIADTSTAINLNATGCAHQILRALPNKLVLVDIVVAELKDDRATGRPDAALTSGLVDSGLVTVASLGEQGTKMFERLVVGPAVDTLDDGEAATLAYAIETGGIPVIDERKARRIWSEQGYVGPIASTIDLLAHAAVEEGLGRPALSQAVFAALQDARMAVPSHQIEWVVELIGRDRAAQCASLPRSARSGRS
jgi:predicted nucleic acid-binding protein